MAVQEALRLYGTYHRAYKPLAQILVKDTQTALHGLTRIVEQMQSVVTDTNAVISKGSEGIETYYKLLEAARNLGENYQEEQQQVREARLKEIERKALDMLKHKPYKHRIKLLVSDTVRRYVAARSKQDRFSVGEVAKDLGVQPAPVYQILQSLPYLKKTEVEGRKVFVRKPKK